MAINQPVELLTFESSFVTNFTTNSITAINGALIIAYVRSADLVNLSGDLPWEQVGPKEGEVAAFIALNDSNNFTVTVTGQSASKKVLSIYSVEGNWPLSASSAIKQYKPLSGYIGGGGTAQLTFDQPVTNPTIHYWNFGSTEPTYENTKIGSTFFYHYGSSGAGVDYQESGDQNPSFTYTSTLSWTGVAFELQEITDIPGPILVGQNVNAASTGTTASISHSFQTRPGDVALVIITANDNISPINDNNGVYNFTKDYEEDGQAGETHKQAIFSRVLYADDPTSYNFDVGGGRWTAQIFIYRNIDVSNIYDVAPVLANRLSGTGSEHPVTDISTNYINSVAVALTATDNGNSSYTGIDNGFTNLQYSLNPALERQDLAVANKFLTSAGPIGPTEFSSFVPQDYLTLPMALRAKNASSGTPTPDGTVNAIAGQLDLIGTVPTFATTGGEVRVNALAGILDSVGQTPSSYSSGGEVVTNAVEGILNLLGELPSSYSIGGDVTTQVSGGQLNLLGLTPSFRVTGGQVRVDALSGVLAFTGYIPTTRTEGGEVKVLAVSGVSTFEGLLASVSASGGQALVSALEGSLDLLGETASVFAEGGEVRVNPSNAILDLTGLVPDAYNFIEYVTTTVPSGLLAISGFTPLIRTGGGIVTIDAVSGSLNNVGQIPDIRAEGGFVSVSPLTGQASLTGLIPLAGGTGGEVKAEPLPSVVIATGQTPNVITGGGIVVVNALTGHLELEGLVSNVLSFGGEIAVDVETGELTVIGLTPNARIGSPPSIGYYAAEIEVYSPFEATLNIF